MDNPKSGGGKNTAPTEIELNLYEWQGNYIDTIHSTSLTTCKVLTPCEILEDYFWVPFIWDIDVSPGEYIWTLECLYGPHDGSFIVSYQAYTGYSLYPCWVNGYSHNAVTSRILGIESEESWEGVLCADDIFYSGGFRGYGGHSNIKVNNRTEYKNMLSSKAGCNCVKVGSGAYDFQNLSFETGDFTDWLSGGNSGFGKTVTTEWYSDGVYSCKIYISDGSVIGSGKNTHIYQQASTYYSGWTILFDLYIPTSDPRLKLEVYNAYSKNLVAGTYLNESATLTSTLLMFKLVCTTSIPTTGSSVYIDNIRLTPPITPDIPVGRIARNSSDIVLV